MTPKFPETLENATNLAGEGTETTLERKEESDTVKNVLRETDVIGHAVDLHADEARREGIVTIQGKSLDASNQDDLGKHLKGILTISIHLDNVPKVFPHKALLSREIVVEEEIAMAIIVVEDMIDVTVEIAIEMNVIVAADPKGVIAITEMIWPRIHTFKRKIQTNRFQSKAKKEKAIFSGMASNGFPVSVRENTSIPCKRT